MPVGRDPEPVVAPQPGATQEQVATVGDLDPLGNCGGQAEHFEPFCVDARSCDGEIERCCHASRLPAATQYGHSSRIVSEDGITAVVRDCNIDDAVVFEHYGDILADLGRLSEAQDNWRRALDLDPDNEELREKLER